MQSLSRLLLLLSQRLAARQRRVARRQGTLNGMNAAVQLVYSFALLLNTDIQLAHTRHDSLERRHYPVNYLAGGIGCATPLGDAALRRLDSRTNLAGRGIGALGEFAHLACHHGEATPLLAGAGGLYRGIQRQQIGLEGDVVDIRQQRGNPPGRAVDLGNCRLQHADLLTPVDDRRRGLPGQLACGLDLGGSLACRRRKLGGTGSNPLDLHLVGTGLILQRGLGIEQ
ncbi:hypothetical protein QC821_03285 [Halomonas qiaohouensis]|uniref:Uncharacterized protein n=1 Tax=Franzmannia qiaohouensis TaxID=1329370 RepID=A0ABU1HA04_9GAMM|nr:hypothetical protein [Halomonas qiaohouensis]MDR5904292.1 hypothetical protein [Halomonas qiaohouensis]